MFCPVCSNELVFKKSIKDIPTYHDKYFCSTCVKFWVVTYTINGELLHITEGREDENAIQTITRRNEKT